MVFENLVVYLLDKYLSDYIENLDTKKLKIDLWSGNVVLENLYLKPNALDDLNLPVTISLGYLEKLTLEVPWKTVYTSPTKATIDGLFLLVVPKTEVEYDAKRDEKEKHEAKMREVHKIEELRKEQEAQQNSKESNKNNDTFMERMQLQIIRNLELSIRNIHVVYEDKSTKPDHPFAIGFTLNYITLHTTNPNWQPTVLKEDTACIHKLGDLSALSIYWNTNAQSRSGLSRNAVLKSLKEHIAINNKTAPKNISYILRPLNIKAKIILVMKPRQEEFKKPMFDIKIDLDEISLNINRDQYLDLLDLLEFQDYLSIKSKYIKYQIKNDIEKKPSRKRWKFAYEAIVNEDVRPRFDCYKWKNIKAHLDRRREYRSIYIQDLLGKVTVEQKQRAQILEKKLDVFNLTYVRCAAEIEAKKKTEQESKTWWGGVSSWWSGNKPQDDPNLDLQKVMSLDEKKKLYDAIGYEGDDISTSTYPEEYIDIDLAIQLNLLEVNVWSKVNQDDAQVSAGLGSFQVFGIATDSNESDFSNQSRPILAQPVSRLLSSTSKMEKKLLEVEYETNPIDKLADFRVKVISQSLEIKYNAPTINKLSECFEQDTQRNLQGVKQVAYSTYTNVKHRSYILMKHNIENIKVLDVYLDLQSSYFLLPENGVYQDGVAVMCMDLGHLTFKRSDQGDQVASLKEAKDIEEAREKSYTQFELKLEDVQLIYANRNESWKEARQEKDTRLHLIKPMKLDLDLGKCIYTDDADLPAWKVAGNLPNVDLRLSNKRLFQIINHMESILLPKSKTSAIVAPSIESESLPVQSTLSDTEQTLQAVEGIAPVKETKETDEGEKSVDNNEKKQEFEGQLTQLEAMFTLNRIDIHIDESSNDKDEDQPFLRLTLESIVAKTTIKTFDMDFDASLANLIVYHEQFIGKDNQNLRLLSAELEQMNGPDSQKLVCFKYHHTSSENPLFLSPDYDGIEDRVQVHFSKLVVTLQLEALLSIFRFQDSLMKKLPQATAEDQAKQKREQEQKNIEVNDKTGQIVKKHNAAAVPSLKIDADLDEFRVIFASKRAKLFDILIQGIKANVSQAPEQTLINLILSDLRVLDPYQQARYRQIISQQSDDKELLRVDLSLFNYPEGYVKGIDVYDCDVQVQFAKATIVFLFKHIDALLGFLDSLNITKAALSLASTQASAAYEQVQKLQEQAFKVHLNVIFNAPNIIIPINSYSDQALFFDLGKLTLKTNFYDDPKKLLVEQQTIRLENILASRVKFDQDYNVIGEVVLIECAELNTSIHRLLYPDKIKTEPAVSIKIDWESVDFQLANDDYTSVMKVLMENFSENIRDQIPEGFQNDQFHYKQAEQEKQEDQLVDSFIKKQKESHTDDVLQTLKIRAEIKKMALMLYLGESDLTVRRVPRNNKLKLANVQIDTLEAVFRQKSDGGYKATGRVKNLLLDDLRATNKTTSITRMMDRHFTVDPNAHMFAASFEFKPKNQSCETGLRQITAQLESLYICVNLDYLMTLEDFFVSGLPTDNAKTQQAITQIDQCESDQNQVKAAVVSPKSSQSTTSQPSNADVETRLEVSVKNPEIILLEDYHDSNSNCLVLDLALQMRIIQVDNETKLYGWLKDLTIYSTNFAELKNTKNSDSKVKYRILQPAKADIFLTLNDEQQKIDVRISDIIVSIAPAAIRTVISVTNSLGTRQSVTQEETQKLTSKGLFTSKSFKEGNFWFTKEFEKQNNVEEISPVQQITITEEIRKPLAQLLILNLDTIEVKLEVGLGSVTKSVVAMCLSNLIVDVKNWSSKALLSTETNVSPTKSKTVILLRFDHLLNITMTKSGLELLQHLSALFNDVYNKRLPPSDDDDQPMLSLSNQTGQKIIISNLDGLQFASNPSIKSITLQQNESIPLNVWHEHQIVGRLSVIDAQNRQQRQEFSVQIGDVKKTVSINRTLQRIYTLHGLSNIQLPIQMLCNTQIENDRRRVILSSIVRIYNHTTLPLLILNTDPTNRKKHKRLARIDVNKDYYVPIDLIYAHGPIFIAVDEDEQVHDFFSFDCKKEILSETKLKLKNGKQADFIVRVLSEKFAHLIVIYLQIFKEVMDSYSENTNELGDFCFNIYIQPALHLTSLLPIDVECSIDNVEQFSLKPSELYLATFGSKTSSLIFTIPSNNNIKWVSDPVDLKVQGQGDDNEHIVILHNQTDPSSQQILRMILRVDAFHESYRLLFYAPFWILNRTDLKLDFQIENNRTLIDVVERPYLICPEKIGNEASKKGQIAVHSTEQGDAQSKWSEKFSLDVIKSTGLTSCKVCVDIVTSSFGLTKLVTLSPSMFIINKSTVAIEVVETVSGAEQGEWKTINPEQLIPFWPRNIQDGLMHVRYVHNRLTSKSFKTNQKYRTLLRMDDEEQPAIHIDVTATDFDGVKVIFEDYKIGDAPLLIVNLFENDSISFRQSKDIRTEILPPLNYVYYTWIDPLQPKLLLVSRGSQTKELELILQIGPLGKEGDPVYAIFLDGVQTVLLFCDDSKLLETIAVKSSFSDSMDQQIQIGIQDIGISIVNDISREEIFYISLNKSKTVWTEMKKSRVKLLPSDINEHLEELYRTHTEQCEINPDDKHLLEKIYQMEGFRKVTLHDDTAELTDFKDQKKTANRQALDAVWIEYSFSSTMNSALYLRINRLQIDNQLSYTMFPVMLHPIIPKSTASEYVGKPFIELSIYESKLAQSNIKQFKYFKLLIQEFAVQIDQGLIVAILSFLTKHNINSPPMINMSSDLEQIQKPFDAIIKSQIDSPSGEIEMFFDNIHLSPLKIHVSFSMHGSNPSEELLNEYPLVGFLLQTLNVAEVQDVILRLGYYERNNEKLTTTKLTNEVSSHYQNQFMKQLHVLVLGLDVLGNPLAVIRGLAHGVESFFYEPYKGAIEGPLEFAEGVATGVRALFGSAVGGAAGAVSKITSVLGKGLATLTFDENYKASRIRRKEPGATAASHIAVGGKNVVMGFVDGVKGVVTKPIEGAKDSGASGFFKGLGKGVIGLVARPTGGVVDFASSSFDRIKRTAQQEELVRRVRYPRHINPDGLVGPYIAHEAMGFYILNRLEDGNIAKRETYVAHITCSEDPLCWLMTTSKSLLFIIEVSILGLYKIDWQLAYEELNGAPTMNTSTGQIHILPKESKTTGLLKTKTTRAVPKLVKYRTVSEAKVN
ncbi:unnamed protein product [Rotaria sp. Silwood1]|nr:unnamed protein product [Rotaria sp. Silwood1]